jgi:hypothetical protein
MGFGGYRRFPGQQRNFGSKQPSVSDSTASMKMMLSSARSLDGITVEQLTRMYRVTPQIAEYELTIARQKRA